MLSLSSAQRQALATAADRSISDALDGSVAGWKPTAPADEAEAVAAVVSLGLPAAAAGWRATLRPLGYHAQITGVFCPTTPKVRFDDIHGQPQPACELADLLIIVEDGATQAPPDRRALLVSAKRTRQPTRALSGPDLVQLDLYQRSPDFSFHNGPYPRNSRDIRQPPGDPADSFAYGLVDLLPGTVGWEQLPPADPLLTGSGRSLGTTLAEMATGQAGRPAIPIGRDDWSSTVDELLRTTLSTVAGRHPGAPPHGFTPLAFPSPAGGGDMGFVLQPPPGGGDPSFRALSVIFVWLTRLAGAEGPARHA
jgi:hypothetical protein